MGVPCVCVGLPEGEAGRVHVLPANKHEGFSGCVGLVGDPFPVTKLPSVEYQPGNPRSGATTSPSIDSGKKNTRAILPTSRTAFVMSCFRISFANPTTLDGIDIR